MKAYRRRKDHPSNNKIIGNSLTSCLIMFHISAGPAFLERLQLMEKSESDEQRGIVPERERKRDDDEGMEAGNN